MRVGGEHDVRSERCDEHELAVVTHLDDLRRRDRLLFEETRDEVDVDQRLAAQKHEDAFDIFIREELDAPSTLGGKSNHRFELRAAGERGMLSHPPLCAKVSGSSTR